MLAGTLAIAGKDLRQRLRDRSALVLGFVAPLVMVVLMSAAFGGAGTFHVELGLVDRDGGPIGTGFAEALGSPDLADLVTVHRYDDRAGAREAVDGGEVDAALVLPEGLSAMATGGPLVPVDVFSSVDSDLAGSVASALAGSLTSRVATARLVAAVARDVDVPAERASALAAAQAQAKPPVAAVSEHLGSRELQGVAYFGPSMGMFFVLFAIGFTARSFFQERQNGTLDRMVASPIPSASVLVGKGLSVFVYSLASLATMALVTGLALGASWGSPVGVAVLCAAMAASVVVLAVLVMVVARTERQAESMSSILTFALALMGGSFMFLGSAPPLMRRLAVLTPNGWALRGFTDLGTGVDTWSAVGRPLAGMAAFAIVVGLLTVAFGRGALSR